MLNTRTSTYQNPINFFVNPLQNQKSPYEKCDNAYTFGFNGQEKDDEMKGSGNSYDFGARIYDSRLGRWLATDPRFKEYTSISSYSFGLNSPIFFKDADGEVIVDGKGNTVTLGPPQKQADGTYSSTFVFKDGTPQEIKDLFMANGGRVINALIQTPTGRKQVQKAIDSKNNIHVSVSPETKEETTIVKDVISGSSEEVTKTTLGVTVFMTHINAKTDERSEIIQITIYEGSIDAVKNDKDGIPRMWKENNLNKEQKVGAVAGHEFEHATNPEHVAGLKNGGVTDEQHKDAYDVEKEIINESGPTNK